MSYCEDCNNDCNKCQVILHPWDNMCLDIIKEKYLQRGQAEDHQALSRKACQAFGSDLSLINNPIRCEGCQNSLAREGTEVQIPSSSTTKKLCDRCIADTEGNLARFGLKLIRK